MIVTCEKCHRRYNLQEDKLRGDARRVRCRNCKSLITLPPRESKEGPAPPAPESAAAPTPKGPATPALKDAAAPKSKALAPKGPAGPTPKSSAAPAPKDAPAPTPRTRRWYAMVQGERTGPFGDDALAAKAREGEITSQTFVWHRGMADWKRAGDVADASSLIAAGGPTPSSPPAPAVQTSTKGPRPATPMDRRITAPGGGAANVAGEEETAPVESADPVAELAAAESTQSPPLLEEPHVFLSAIGRRHPHWKFAPALVALVALPLMLVFMFSGPPLPSAQGTRPDDSGPEERGSTPSSGRSRLGDLLLGRRSGQRGSSGGPRRGAAEPPLLQKAGPAGNNASTSKPAESAPTAKPGEVSEALASTGGPQPELNALYGDGTHTDVGPRLRKGEDEKGKDTTVGGLGQKEVAKVVSRAQPAFQFCIEQELKKNPKFRRGKIFITATIGGSGVVKHAAVDRPEVDSSPLGECLKGKARRLVFPAFSGDETEIQIPLILGATM